MIKNIFKKVIVSVLTVTLVLPASLLPAPKRAEAQMAVAETGPSLVQQIINTGNGVITSASTYSIQLKEYVLDGLGLLIAKQIIRQITTSVVNWINTGFEGSPSFLQNPGSFFLDVADQITGDFLAKYGGPLQDLCSPFSIDIRLALAFKYHPNIPKRYECTLGKIISNSKTAIEGASINGFTAGDFKQGGWPAFASLTTEPQNNVYGAYLTAESELSVRVANAELTKRDEIGAGSGFLSWKDPQCAREVREYNKALEASYQQGTSDYGAAIDTYNTEGTLDKPQLRSKEECKTQTPGSVIQTQLNNHLSGPLRELELADEINEIVNALFAQLVKQVLQAGLGTVSGSGAGDSSSYIGEIQAEARTGSADQVNSLRASTLNGMEVNLNNTYDYKAVRDSTLALVINAKERYEDVKACYVNKITDPKYSLSSSEKRDAQDEIDDVDQRIETRITPLASRYLLYAQDAETRLSILLDIKNKINLAQTVNDMNEPISKYGELVQSNSLTTFKEIVDAGEEKKEVQAQVSDMQDEAADMLRDCQVFPAGRF